MLLYINQLLGDKYLPISNERAAESPGALRTNVLLYTLKYTTQAYYRVGFRSGVLSPS